MKRMRLFTLIGCVIFLTSCSTYSLHEKYVTSLVNNGDTNTYSVFFKTSDSTFKLFFQLSYCDTLYGSYFQKRNRIILYPTFLKIEKHRTNYISSDSVRIVFWRGPIRESCPDFPKDSLANSHLILNGKEYKTDSLGVVLIPLKKTESISIKVTQPKLNNYFIISNNDSAEYHVTYDQTENINPKGLEFRIINEYKIKNKAGFILQTEKNNITIE